MSKILDPWTRRYLAGLGVGQGWRCLELGGGNGSITEWLCAAVGPSGSVTAADINTVLLDLVPAQNLTVRQLDVRTGELPENAYDLVTCRALLHQIAEYAPAVLTRMAAAVKPGGWLLVQEPDFHLAPTTEPAAWATTWKALIEWGHANGIDWLIGRKLPSMVSKLGLGQSQAKTYVQNIRGRDRGALYFQLFFAEVRDRVVGSGQLDAA
ncbi:MAG TPA: class I SAM-dependent methyltransferase, partial [Actinomycetes bacterium]